jgi:hypothetical protein
MGPLAFLVDTLGHRTAFHLAENEVRECFRAGPVSWCRRGKRIERSVIRRVDILLSSAIWLTQVP